MTHLIALLLCATSAATLLKVLVQREIDPCQISLTTGIDADRKQIFLDLSYRRRWRGHVAALRPLLEPPFDRHVTAHGYLEDDLHGRGLGTLMYLAAAEAFRREGRPLMSSWKPAPSSEKLWRRLVDLGHARIVTMDPGDERYEMNLDAVFAADPGLAEFIRARLHEGTR